METEIKPKVLQTVYNLTKEYNKLIKYQNEKRMEVHKLVFSPYVAAIKLLSKLLTKQEISHIVTREPGGTKFSEKIRNLVNPYFTIVRRIDFV